MKETKIVSGSQCRAARALLDWSLDDLEQHSGVSREAIHGFEKGKTRQQKPATMQKLADCFEKHGIEFLKHDGVRRSDNTFKLIEGDDSYLRLLDDVEATLTRGGEALFLMVDNALSSKAVIAKDARLRRRGVKFRHLISEKNPYCLYPAEEYRCVPQAFFTNNTQIIYGDKIGIMINGDECCLIVKNKTLAASVKSLFEIIWSTHKPPKK